MILLLICTPEASVQQELIIKRKQIMAKVKLTQQELAALDALIAELQNGNKTVEADFAEPAFITAVARVAVQATKVAIKATPYVADVAEVATAILGREAKDETNKQLEKLAREGLSVEKLIELRKRFN